MTNINNAIDRVIQKEPLFTSLVSRLTLKQDKECPTMGTDGETLLYNQKFLDTLTEDEAAAVVLHETMHCAFAHVWRRDKREPMGWNCATDLAINGMVSESFPLPKGSLYDAKYYGMSAEEIYDSLPVVKLKVQVWCEKDGWEEQGKKDQKGEGKNDKEGEKEGLMDKIKKAFGGNSAKPQSGKSKTAKQKQLEKEWEEAFKDVIMKDFGTMSHTLRRAVEKALYMPAIDWTELVMHLLTEDITDYSFSVPDRRFLEQEYILPDLYSFDRLKDVVFAYDTSGSITDFDLFTFYMETLNLFNNFSSLTGWIAICDAALHSFEEIDITKANDQMDFLGRGGTDFRPVFEEIDKRGLSPKALFYFTDTYGSFPDKEPIYPVYWLVRSDLTDGWGTPNVPWGTVIKFIPKQNK